jgi:hypothetical protein
MKDEAINTHTCGSGAVRTTIVRTNGIGTGGEEYTAVENKEKRWHKDMVPTRLRHDGQP